MAGTSRKSFGVRSITPLRWSERDKAPCLYRFIEYSLADRFKGVRKTLRGNENGPGSETRRLASHASRGEQNVPPAKSGRDVA